MRDGMILGLRSDTPGRSRWDVPAVLGRPEFAAELAMQLRASALIEYGFANPVSGRVLLRYPREHATASVAQALTEAIWRTHDRLRGNVDGSADGRIGGDTAAAGSRVRRSRRPRTLARLFAGRRGKVARAAGYTALSQALWGLPVVGVGLLLETVTKGRSAGLARIGIARTHSQVAALTALIVLPHISNAWVWAAANVKWRGLVMEVQHDLRMAAYRRIQNADYAHRERFHTGQLMAVLQSDIQHIGLLGVEAAKATEIVVWALVTGVALYVYLPKILVVNLLLGPLVAWATSYYQQRAKLRYDLSSDYAAQLSEQLASSLGGLRTTTSFGAEAYEIRRTGWASAALSTSSEHAVRSGEGASIPIQWLYWLGMAVAFHAGGLAVWRGKLALSTFFAVVTTNKQMLQCLGDLGLIIDHHRRVSSSSERVFEVIDTWPEPCDGAKRLDADALRGDVAFDGVYFEYEQGRPVVDGVSLRCAAKTMTAIVGPTGAGKSTLMKLLLRNYLASRGSVCIDGVDVRELDRESLRNCIAVVDQDCFLFQGTIAENIAYGESRVDMARVRTAAHMAEAADFVESLPQGYDTMVGERGTRLSGGQRQRIAIARAVFAQTPILILDEATSAVDNETELAIQRSLRRILQDRTTIVIAHRLSTIRNADRIYVLDQGRVSEAGTHGELLARKGKYAELWNIQIGASERLAVSDRG